MILIVVVLLFTGTAIGLPVNKLTSSCHNIKFIGQHFMTMDDFEILRDACCSNYLDFKKSQGITEVKEECTLVLRTTGEVDKKVGPKSYRFHDCSQAARSCIRPYYFQKVKDDQEFQRALISAKRLDISSTADALDHMSKNISSYIKDIQNVTPSQAPDGEVEYDSSEEEQGKKDEIDEIKIDGMDEVVENMKGDGPVKFCTGLQSPPNPVDMAKLDDAKRKLERPIIFIHRDFQACVGFESVTKDHNLCYLLRKFDTNSVTADDDRELPCNVDHEIDTHSLGMNNEERSKFIDLLGTSSMSCKPGYPTVEVCWIAEKSEEGSKIWKTVSIRLGDEFRQLFVYIKCRVLCFNSVCSVSVTGEGDKAIIELTSRAGKYHITDGSKTYEGTFLGKKTIDFMFETEGHKVLHGTCNDVHMKRRIIMTLSEFCDARFEGISMKPMNVWCKHSSGITKVCIAILVFLILYFLAEPCAAIISTVFSLISFAITYLFFWGTMCRKCYRFKCGKGHRCRPTTCPYCNLDLEFQPGDGDETTIKEKFDKHFQVCRSRKFSAMWWICLRNLFTFFYTIFLFIFSKLPRLSLGICLIVLAMYMIPGVDASFADEVAKRLYEIEKNESSKIILDERHTETIIPKICSLEWIACFYSLMMTLIASCVAIMAMSRMIASRKMNWHMRNGRNVCKYCMQITGENHEEEDCVTFCCPACHTISGLLPQDDYAHLDWMKNVHLTRHHFQDCKIIYKARESNRIRKNAFKASKVLIFLMTLMMFLNLGNCSHSEEMNKVDRDLSNYIEDLKRNGFHPFHSRFTGGARLYIADAKEEKRCNKGKCVVGVTIESDMTVRPGKEYGYLIKTSVAELKFNTKVSEPKANCRYKIIYKTGEATHSAVTGDTCTESCSKCLENAREHAKDDKSYTLAQRHIRNHPDSSSWSCDGFGCASIGGGCTCLECWCHLTESSHLWDVLELVEEKHEFDICVSIGNEGYCKKITGTERSKVVNVLEYSQGLKLCPARITCNAGVCKTGEINGVNDNFNRFGSVKLIGNYTASYKEIEAEEICHFGQHRYFTMTKCCMDTFHLKDNLKTVALVGKGTDKELHVNSLGSWKIRIRLPNLVVTQKVDEIVLKSMQVTSCHGCHGCDEGGSCILETWSSHDHLFPFYCKKCTTDTDHIQLKKGNNHVPFNIYCPAQNTKSDCWVGKFNVSFQATLSDKPKTPHGDQIVNVDISKNIGDECETWFCSFGLPFADLWKRFKLALIIIFSSILFFIVVYLLILLIRKLM